MSAWAGDTFQEKGSYESLSNRVSSLTQQSTNVQYPGAKCVYDALATKTQLSDISAEVLRKKSVYGDDWEVERVKEESGAQDVSIMYAYFNDESEWGGGTYWYIDFEYLIDGEWQYSGESIEATYDATELDG